MSSTKLATHSTVAANTSLAHEAVQEAQATWLWEYAALRAPDYDEMYYLKFTLLSCAWFVFLHLAVHLLASRHARVYQ